jgi:hypothetical protein
MLKRYLFTDRPIVNQGSNSLIKKQHRAVTKQGWAEQDPTAVITLCELLVCIDAFEFQNVTHNVVTHVLRNAGLKDRTLSPNLPEGPICNSRRKLSKMPIASDLVHSTLRWLLFYMNRKACRLLSSGVWIEVYRFWRTCCLHLRCPWRLQTRRHHSPEDSNRLEELYLLEYNAVYSVESHLFRRNMSRLSSRSKNRPSKKPAWSSMLTTCSSETSVDFQRTTRRYIPEDRTLHNHRCENIRSYTVIAVFTSVRTLNLTRKAWFGAPGRQRVKSSRLSFGYLR